MALVVVACGPPARSASPGAHVSAPASSPAAVSPTIPASPATSLLPTPVPGGSASAAGLVDVGGHRLWLACEGQGSPTVVLEAGLGSGHEAWARVAPGVAAVTRVCVYDRAGIGQSDPRPETTSTAGAMADELVRLLAGAGLDGPVLLAGHSYGGMIVQLAADRNPGLVAGAVLVDSSSRGQFVESFSVTDFVWEDRATTIDKAATAAELAAVDLEAMPLIVLTQDNLDSALGADWARFQSELAGLSSTSLHLVASGSGHGIPDEAPDLVIAAIAAVVAVVRDGAPLPACEAFAPDGGECFPT